MATIAELERALVNADKAGDVDAAKVLAGEILRLRSTSFVSEPEKPIDPTEGMSGSEKFLAGAGKAFYDIGRGVGTLVTDAVPSAAKYGFATRADVDEANKRDAALMNTGAGIAGNITGNLAAYAPLALVPGAATVGGGAAIGAATGLTQAVGADDSRIKNAAIGAGAGAAVPAAIRTAKALRAGLVDPFTEAGRNRIAGSVINRSAADPAAVSQRLQTVQGNTPGFTPTVGQAADDAGVASLERTMRAIDPKGFDAVDKSQRQALADALRSVAKTPEARAAAVKNVERQAKNLYGEAFKENVEVTPELVRIASRPSMRRAEQRAIDLADELSMPFQARLKDMKPQYIPMEGAKPAPSLVLKESTIPGKPMPAGGMSPPVTNIERVAVQGDKRLPSYFEVPPVESVPVRDMHTLKMGMDALMGDPTLGIAGREAAAINRTRNQFLDLLPESYQTARTAHIEMNKPVNQMDIGRELYKRFVPALADEADAPFKTRADSLAQALREGDELAKSVTGLKNAKLEAIMEPDQMTLLQGVVKDAQMKAAAEAAGKGSGSDTVQKIAMTNLAAEAGVPNWLASVARVPGGWAKRLGDVLYGSSDEQVRARLAEILTNPQEAAAAMEAAGATPSQIAEALKLGAQGVGLTAFPVLNANQ